MTEGYLWKWTNYFGGWQQRWFILKEGTLTYYLDHNTTNTGCKGSFKLEACNIIVNPADPLRFDLHTSTQRIYLKTDTKHLRQKWVIQLGTTKANISEGFEDSSLQASLPSYNEHKAELKTLKTLLVDQIDKLSQLCEEEEIDGEKLKETKAMINELCDEFVTTLNDCTDSVTGIDKESPLVDTPTISLGTPPCFPSVTNNDKLLKSVEESLDDDELNSSITSEEGLLSCVGTKRADKLPITYFSNIGDRFEDMRINKDYIPTIAFLDAASALPKLLVAIGGKSFITLSVDIGNNIQKLRNRFEFNPRKSTSLQGLIHLEISTGKTQAKHSATTALLWLYREMQFVKQFLLGLIEGESNLSDTFMECYEMTLKKYHNVMSKSLYTVAAKTIPYKEDIMRSMGHDGITKSIQEALYMDMTTYSKAIGVIVFYIEQFYINNKIATV